MDKQKTLTTVYQESGAFAKYREALAALEDLNAILQKCMADDLLAHCHIGAVDSEKNLVVLFVDSQPVLHLVRHLGTSILQTFASHGYMFDSLLTRVSSQTYRRQTAFVRPTDKELDI